MVTKTSGARFPRSHRLHTHEVRSLAGLNHLCSCLRVLPSQKAKHQEGRVWIDYTVIVGHLLLITPSFAAEEKHVLFSVWHGFDSCCSENAPQGAEGSKAREKCYDTSLIKQNPDFIHLFCFPLLFYVGYYLYRDIHHRHRLRALFIGFICTINFASLKFVLCFIDGGM